MLIFKEKKRTFVAFSEYMNFNILSQLDFFVVSHLSRVRKYQLSLLGSLVQPSKFPYVQTNSAYHSIDCDMTREYMVASHNFESVVHLGPVATLLETKTTP